MALPGSSPASCPWCHLLAHSWHATSSPVGARWLYPLSLSALLVLELHHPGNTPPQRLRHAYDMVKVSSYALRISPQQLAGCLWLLRCSYECLSGATALPHCPLPNTLTSHPWLRLVPAAFTRLSTLKNLGVILHFTPPQAPRVAKSSCVGLPHHLLRYNPLSLL